MDDSSDSKSGSPKDVSHKTTPKPKNSPATQSRAERIIKSVIPHKVSLEHKHDDDTLIDVKLANPLRRITQLLEEIKKQKAFTFTLKGSLGVAGIAMIVTTFGIFGGTKAFCSKGTQTHQGTLRMLQIKEGSDRSFIVERAMIVYDAITGRDFQRRNRNRIVLLKDDGSVISVSERIADLSLPNYQFPVIVTGDFDSCSQTLTLKSSDGVEQL